MRKKIIEHHKKYYRRGGYIDYKLLALDLTPDILNFIVKNNLYVNLYLEGKVYANKAGREAEYYKQIMGVEPTIIKRDLISFLNKPTIKMLIIEKDSNKVIEYTKKLKNRFGNYSNITNSLSEGIDIMKKGVSKGSALKKLTKKLEISSQQIIAIGDQPNDLEMINYVGQGVAVANAEERLKAEADYITNSNSQSGVATTIDKFIL